ncbi:hypothetical protein KKG36_01120, partial [Patescibacteria group bacterium]|nr:hypothetical protein [Patescibacteria group bacterium]
MREGEPKEFLEEKYPDLQKSKEVASAVRRQDRRTGEKVVQQPKERIEAYLDRLEEVFNPDNPDKRERRVSILKDKLHDLFVIKPEDIPVSYFNHQRQIAREQGHGDIEITPELRQQLAETIISDQSQSLDAWIDYLGSEDAPYPNWLKYFAFRSITKLSAYDKEKKEFKKRSKGTTAPFPDINREALSYVLDALEKSRRKEGATDSEWGKLLKTANFGKLYSHAIETITPASQEERETIRGEWVLFKKGTDPKPLYESLQGHGTGWCTAGEGVARTQLQAGDFYVFYTKSKKGNIPRVAIRMQEGEIAEVRGISADQNLEPVMADVAKEKMKELPGSEKYEKKEKDMRRLTAIERKCKLTEEITKEDLRFLYEVDGKIEGFGYQEDPRIAELLDQRDKRKDLAYVFDTDPSKISFTEEEALKGGIVFHCGDLSLGNLTSAEGLKLPETIGRDLDLRSLVSAEGLKLPETVGGNLWLSNLTSVEGLKLPETVGGHLILRSLVSAEGLKL